MVCGVNNMVMITQKKANELLKKWWKISMKADGPLYELRDMTKDFVEGYTHLAMASAPLTLLGLRLSIAKWSNRSFKEYVRKNKLAPDFTHKCGLCFVQAGCDWCDDMGFDCTETTRKTILRKLKKLEKEVVNKQRKPPKTSKKTSGIGAA